MEADTAAELVSDAPDYVAATITAHHLLLARATPPALATRQK